MADNLLLSAALSNTLANAVKYSPVNGSIVIKITTSNSKSTISNHQNLVITISDEGTGVPAESLKHLFEPFYRVVEVRDRRTGVTGLG
jgi:signal transduction histidine kinase